MDHTIIPYPTTNVCRVPKKTNIINKHPTPDISLSNYHDAEKECLISILLAKIPKTVDILEIKICFST